MCKSLFKQPAVQELLPPAPAAMPITGNENKATVVNTATDQNKGRKAGKVRISGAGADPLRRTGVPGLGL